MIKSRIYNKYYIYNKSFVILNIIAIFVELKIYNNYKIIYSTIIHKNNNNTCKKNNDYFSYYDLLFYYRNKILVNKILIINI